MNDSHDLDRQLLEEIKYCAGKLPPQRQERILEVIRAMLFTRSVILGQEANNGPVEEIDDEV